MISERHISGLDKTQMTMHGMFYHSLLFLWYQEVSFPTLQLFAKVADIQVKHTFLEGVEKDQKWR